VIINLIREKLHIDTFFSNLIKDNQFSEKQVKITKFNIRHHHRKLAEGYGQLSWFQLSNRQIRSTAINPWRIYGGRQEAGWNFSHADSFNAVGAPRRLAGGRRAAAAVQPLDMRRRQPHADGEVRQFLGSRFSFLF